MSEGIRIPDALLAVVERIVNSYLGLDPEGARALAALTGRVIVFEVEGFETRVTVIPCEHGLQLFGAYDAEPDCLIRGAPVTLLRMFSQRQRETQLASGAVTIAGDSSVAQDFSTALAGIDVDWEEQLARLIGDPFARRVGERCRAKEHEARRNGEQLADNLRDYLQKERQLLPTRLEVAAFLEQVDRLRDDSERLAARIERLNMGDATPDTRTGEQQ